jgi:hypothetical protein
MRPFFYLLLIAACIAPTSFAQTAPSTSSASTQSAPQTQPLPEVITPAEKQARQQAVVEMVEAQMPREQFEQMISATETQMLAQLKAQAEENNSEIGPGEVERLKRAITGLVSYDEMVGWLADMYSAHFTVDEIHQIRDFYRTPVGQKLVTLQPQLMQENMQKMFTIAAQRFPEAMKREGLGPKD